MTGDNFSYWFEHDEGTFVAEYDINYTPAVGIASVVMNAGRSTGSNYDISISASRSSDAKAIAAVIDNTTQYSAVPNYSFRNQVNKISIGYKVDDCRLAINGILGAVDGPPSTLPSGLTTLHIGTTDANVLPLYGHIRKITYYYQRVTDEELVTLTS